jgi:hypothetical protein
MGEENVNNNESSPNITSKENSKEGFFKTYYGLFVYNPGNNNLKLNFRI